MVPNFNITFLINIFIVEKSTEPDLDPLQCDYKDIQNPVFALFCFFFLMRIKNEVIDQCNLKI